MNSRFYGGIWSIWEKAEDDAANKKWHDELCAILRPFTSHHYKSRVKNSYTPEKWKRLEEVRAKHDPQGLLFGFLGGIT